MKLGIAESTVSLPMSQEIIPSAFPLSSPLLSKSMPPPLSDNLNCLDAEVWNILPLPSSPAPWLPSHTLAGTGSFQFSWNTLSTTAATSLVHMVTTAHLNFCNKWPD